MLPHIIASTCQTIAFCLPPLVVGETGSPTDDQLVIPYMSHRQSKIRRAVIKALAQLNFGSHVHLFFEALNDAAPQVSREAFMSLIKGRAMINGERLWNLFNSTEQFHVKRGAVILIAKLDKWDSIYYLLKTLQNSEEKLVSLIKFWIQDWLGRFNRSFVTPTGEQVAGILRGLDECGERMEVDLRDQLFFALRSFR